MVLPLSPFRLPSATLLQTTVNTHISICEIKLCEAVSVIHFVQLQKKDFAVGIVRR